jgi:hypothetical protein
VPKASIRINVCKGSGSKPQVRHNAMKKTEISSLNNLKYLKMKKGILFSFIVILAIMTSCKKDKPTACISCSTATMCTGQMIELVNCSTNSDHIEWTLPDGSTSIQDRVDYVFDDPGHYTFWLKSFSKDHLFSDKTSFDINVVSAQNLLIGTWYVTDHYTILNNIDIIDTGINNYTMTMVADTSPNSIKIYNYSILGLQVHGFISHDWDEGWPTSTYLYVPYQYALDSNNILWAVQDELIFPDFPRDANYMIFSYMNFHSPTGIAGSCSAIRTSK